MSSVIIVIVFLVLSAALAGVVLHSLSRRLEAPRGRLDGLIERINGELPQLQCGECGYPGCRPYAAAVAREEVGIGDCPPGGTETVKRLAVLLNLPSPSLAPPPPRRIAFIRADDCVGCALCLPVCPTDAIVGAARRVHTVIEADCVGCGLCLPPCPVDCIDMAETGRDG